ncbi:hypothetical protein QCA50_001410 [Cerrena zonata]|uniref:Uncharacterized protein n=1 Tax=Cerrena zonata TaxID=2478898 RepID=A0AAW0GLX6_9APHY
MARATRSSATQDKDITNDPIPSNRKNPKKRKRTSIADPSEQPALKQQRNDGDIKEEDEQNHLDDSLSQEVIEINLPSTGDVPIQSQDAENILQVLVVIDNQSLLDRPVPLPSEAAESSTSTTSASSSPTHTLRNLLQNASHYPMRTIRAVMQLLGPGSNPRSRPNPPELEQQRFCDLAISLLDQASSQNTPVPLNIDSIISAYVSSTAWSIRHHSGLRVDTSSKGGTELFCGRFSKSQIRSSPTITNGRLVVFRRHVFSVRCQECTGPAYRPSRARCHFAFDIRRGGRREDSG